MTDRAAARRMLVMCLALAAALLAVCLPAVAWGQQTTITARPTGTSVIARNWIRAEAWRFFDPPATGGDPDYEDVATRLQFGVRHVGRRVELEGVVQVVQFGGLPTAAAGPGALGVGSLYHRHAGRTDSGQTYLRYLNLRLVDLAPGLSLRVGRMGFTSGAEITARDAKIEAVKRQRLTSRLIGEFEWSLYQRGYDGVRLDWDRSAWHVSAAAFRPTQGGFEDAAGRQMSDIDLFALSLTARPGGLVPNTETQLFAYRYDDQRAVTARPDNSGRTADRVDVTVTAIGGSLVGAFRSDRGELDALLWLVGQTGSWYGQTHRAVALAGELGYQWTGVAWSPWLRGGLQYASGDSDPDDERHGTFFQMLPTGRRFSQTATYSLMTRAAFARAHTADSSRN